MTRSIRWSRLALRSMTAAVALAIGVSVVGGCAGVAELPPPDFSTMQRMAIAPFMAPHDSTFGMRTARDLSNQLQIVLKRDVEGFQIVFDESGDRRPVSEAVEELGITLEEAYADPKLAGKVAAKLGVDMILIGNVREPRFKTDESDRPVYDMSEYAGLSKGDTIYVITYQNVTTRIWLKAVSAAGELVWQTGSPPPEEPGHVQAYIKYARAHKLQAPERPVVEQEQIVTHLRDHIWRLLAHRLYPSKFREIVVPHWQEKPTQTFKTSGGDLEFK
jgi:hypothetical protein